MAPRSPAESFLTIREVAKRLAVCERSVRRLIAAGALPFHKFGESVRISEADLAAYIAACRRA